MSTDVFVIVVMAFNFKSDQERLAFEGNDVDTHPQTGVINRSRFYLYNN